jgi:hypothetical protein
MSALSYFERINLEKLFDMGGGYVLNFSNRTFQEFMADRAKCDIYSEKYLFGSGSKANRLRRFWVIEPSHLVGKILHDLINIAIEVSFQKENTKLIDDCRKTANRLLQGAPVEEFDIIVDELSDDSFESLVNSIRGSLNLNNPEAGLDHLHTFVNKYLHYLCDKRGISYTKDRPLHSLIGEYIKVIKKEGKIASEMTERILKSSIANFEAFSFVRNDNSLAHDNPLLNYDESLLIFNHIVSSIRFIQSLERRGINKMNDVHISDEEIPF